MGVSGLWKLLEGTERPVTLESLEGKVVAVDISIWLNMAVKGMRDLHGHASNNAHLVTLFNRICKLLHSGIKPIFVFDGQTPLLKLKTVRERREKKNIHLQESKVASEKIMQNYLKREVLKLAIKKQNKSSKSGSTEESEHHTEVETGETSQKILRKSLKTVQDTTDDLYVLPPMKDGLQVSSSDEEQESNWNIRSSTRDALYGAAMAEQFDDIMSVDVESEDFKSLPADLQHEMLTDMKEIKKRRRTALETMPEKSESFSNYQLSGLLAKHTLSNKIKAVEKEMGDRGTASMAEIALSGAYEADNIAASKISSEDATHYILIQGLKSKTPQTEKPEFTSENTLEKPEPPPSSIIKSKDVNNLESPTSSSESDLSVIHSNKIEKGLRSTAVDEENITIKDTVLDLHPEKSEVITPSVTSKGGVVDVKTLSQPTSETCSTEQMDKQVLLENIQESPPSKTREPAEDEFHKNNSNQHKVQVQNETTPKENDTMQGEPNKMSKMDFAPKNIPSVEDDKKISSSESEEDFVEVEIPEVDKPMPAKITPLKIVSDDESMAELIPASDEIPVSKPNPWAGLKENQLHELGEEMDIEDKALIDRMQASARAARDVTDSATSECQELLQLFGIPYIVSPQEAEAQCAFLNKNGLTAGTITEDSDIWPFGGTVVYKDVFDRKRDPKCYTLGDVKSELGLEQPHFINIALLSGSDYTSGIEGVGPVRALEIMKEFPGEGVESMEKFKTWWTNAHSEVKKVIETKIKGQLRKLNVPTSFPSRVVINAYLEPSVNQSLESFTWGIPDLDGIRSFANQRLQWTKKKIDDDLLPILKRAADRKVNCQPKISSFFMNVSPTKQRKQKSQRVRRALHSVAEKEVKLKTSSTRGGRKRRGAKTKVNTPPKVVKRENQISLGLSESSGSDS